MAPDSFCLGPKHATTHMRSLTGICSFCSTMIRQTKTHLAHTPTHLLNWGGNMAPISALKFTHARNGLFINAAHSVAGVFCAAADGQKKQSCKRCPYNFFHNAKCSVLIVSTWQHEPWRRVCGSFYGCCRSPRLNMQRYTFFLIWRYVRCRKPFVLWDGRKKRQGLKPVACCRRVLGLGAAGGAADYSIQPRMSPFLTNCPCFTQVSISRPPLFMCTFTSA